MLRWTILAAALFGLSACGEKKPPATPVAAVSAPTAPEPAAPPPSPIPEPVAPEPSPPNADLQVALSQADGRMTSGKVIRIERSEDWYAEKGWTDQASKITVTVEDGTSEAELSWNEIASIDIEYGGRSDITCQYNSDYNPWMYLCVLKTTSTVNTHDGRALSPAGRHRWRFTFDGGDTAEFHILKLPHRRQDVAAGERPSENYELYADLQAELLEQVKSTAITQIKITP